MGDKALPNGFARAMEACAEIRVSEGPVPEGGKRCPQCRRIKPLDCFNRDRRTGDGLSCWCKVCRRADKARYRETPEHRDWLTAYHARPETAERLRRWHEANRARKARLDALYAQTLRGKLIKNRNNLRYKMRRARSEEQRARWERLAAAYDAELARIDRAG